jgi:Uma2 family endonuclease
MSRGSTAPQFETIGDVLEQLGGIDGRRIRLHPAPGTATEEDVIAILHREKRKFELVDGVLVEKVMGFLESSLACRLIKLLGNYLDENPIGVLAGEAGAMRLMPGLVRIPDVSFVSWDRLPGRIIPTEPIPDLAPDLGIEVLSEGNTPREMERKRKEYFISNVQVLWFVDVEKRTVEVFTAPDRSLVVAEEETLDGGEVLPGFRLALRELFADVPAVPAPRPRRKSRPRPQRKRDRRK